MPMAFWRPSAVASGPSPCWTASAVPASAAWARASSARSQSQPAVPTRPRATTTPAILSARRPARDWRNSTRSLTRVVPPRDRRHRAARSRSRPLPRRGPRPANPSRRRPGPDTGECGPARPRAPSLRARGRPPGARPRGFLATETDPGAYEEEAGADEQERYLGSGSDHGMLGERDRDLDGQADQGQPREEAGERAGPPFEHPLDPSHGA